MDQEVGAGGAEPLHPSRQHAVHVVYRGLDLLWFPGLKAIRCLKDWLLVQLFPLGAGAV